MAYNTLPILFINLGGEMLYILDQRLHAQNIPDDKSKKVLHDIINTMFNTKFIEELFKPQDLFSKSSMRLLFDKLAHASIMRLNSASMDKLYDLMTMACKYQFYLCQRSSDIMLVTLNHIDTILKYIDEGTSGYQGIQAMMKLLLQNFAHLSDGKWQTVRQTLLNFFQDMHIRVSIFLKDKCQNANGRFAITIGGLLPSGFEKPGVIKIMCGDKQRVQQFNPGQTYTGVSKAGSFERKGDRVTKLGLNMYSTIKTSMDTMLASQSKTKTSFSSSDLEMLTPNPNAKAQLDLLAQIISSNSGTSQTASSNRGEVNSFKLNLFKSESEEVEAGKMRMSQMTDPGYRVVTFDASKGSASAELCRIAGEMSIENSNNEEEKDLLELMDSASVFN